MNQGTEFVNTVTALSAPILQLEDLEKSFGDLLVLKGVSGHVEKGQVIALIGPSGSGKSTLLRCLNLLEVPSAGRLFYKGEDVLSKNFNLQKMRQKIGMVFQNFHLFPHLTALQNVAYAPQKVLGKTKEAAAEAAEELLERVGLADKAAVLPKNLSGGQKQRVAIARCLAMDPEIILFDEPTSALDPEMVKEVLAVIQSLVKTKITSLLVTHEMAFAREIADQIWFMDQGVLVEKSDPKSFFAGPKTDRAKLFLEKVL